MELRGQRIVGVVVEALIRPEAIDIGRRASNFPAKAAEGGHVLIGDADSRQGVGKRVLVELRIGSRSRNRSDVRDKGDLSSRQQLDEFREASVGMADGEEGQRRTPPSFTRGRGRRPYGPRYGRSCRF